MPTRSFMSSFIIHLPCLCRGVIAALVFCFLISSVQCFHLPFLCSPYRALGWCGCWLLDISGGCDKSEWDTNINTAFSRLEWLVRKKVSGRPLNPKKCWNEKLPNSSEGLVLLPFFSFRGLRSLVASLEGGAVSMALGKHQMCKCETANDLKDRF